MWRLLREVAPGARWRKQVPLRHFIVDFASHQAKLAVEIDGGQHSEEADASRTAIIEAEGYRVLRFWNNDVLCTRRVVLYFSAMRLRRDHPHPTPARQQAETFRLGPDPLFSHRLSIHRYPRDVSYLRFRRRCVPTLSLRGASSRPIGNMPAPHTT